MGNFEKWGDHSNGGMILKWGVDTPLQTTHEYKVQNSYAKTRFV